MESKNYRVKLTPIASEDLESIYSYISKKLHNNIAAINILEEIERRVLNLREYPFACSYVEDEYLKDKGYRKLIVKNYIAFYLVDEEKEQVTVMRVLYGKQHYKDFLHVSDKMGDKGVP